MKSGALLLSLTAVSAFALAGCVGGNELDVPLDVEGLLAREKPLLQGTIFEGKDCETSVGLSMAGPLFNDGTIMGLWGEKVGPFPIKDVKEVSGVNFVGIVGMFMLGPPGQDTSTGVFHGMNRCDSYTTAAGTAGEDFGMGWIAAYIQPPEWGEDGIEHHFFVADLSFSDVPLVDHTLDGTSMGLELNPALKAGIGWPAPNLMHGVLHDSMHGLFEFQTPQLPPEPLADKKIRFWTLVHESEVTPPTHFGVNTHGFRDGMDDPANENNGNGEIEGKYYPVVFDLEYKTTPGKSIVRWPAESTGTFGHTEYCHHGYPESEEMEHGHDEGESSCQDNPEKFAANENELWTDAGQTEAGLYEAGYDMTITMGPDYRDQWFDVTWIH